MIITNESKATTTTRTKENSAALPKLCGLALEYHGLKLDTFNGQQEV
jgi:hypothetical protein